MYVIVCYVVSLLKNRPLVVKEVTNMLIRSMGSTHAPYTVHPSEQSDPCLKLRARTRAPTDASRQKYFPGPHRKGDPLTGPARGSPTGGGKGKFTCMYVIVCYIEYMCMYIYTYIIEYML